MKKILLSTVHHPDVSLKNLEYVCEQVQTIFDEVYLTISKPHQKSKVALVRTLFIVLQFSPMEQRMLEEKF